MVWWLVCDYGDLAKDITLTHTQTHTHTHPHVQSSLIKESIRLYLLSENDRNTSVKVEKTSFLSLKWSYSRGTGTFYCVIEGLVQSVLLNVTSHSKNIGPSVTPGVLSDRQEREISLVPDSFSRSAHRTLSGDVTVPQTHASPVLPFPPLTYSSHVPVRRQSTQKETKLSNTVHTFPAILNPKKFFRLSTLKRPRRYCLMVFEPPNLVVFT